MCPRIMTNTFVSMSEEDCAYGESIGLKNLTQQHNNLVFSQKKHIFVNNIRSKKQKTIMLEEPIKGNLPLITEEDLKEIRLSNERLIEIAINDFDEQLKMDEENDVGCNTNGN